MEPKKHTGKKQRIKYVGGDYHGQEKVMRAPIVGVIEVASPPRYLGKGNYDPNVISYQTYGLRYIDGEPVYVWMEWIDDFDKNPSEVINREYESNNNRTIRLEKEEEERQRKLCEADFKKWGFVVIVNGKRVSPGEVKIYVNTKHPHYEQMFIKREKFDERT